MNNMNKRKNDILLILGFLIVAAISLVILIITKKDGATVNVSINGENFGQFDLSENRKIQIGNDYPLATLIIEDKKAYIINSTCPDGLCENQGKISNSGESIVCLPKGIVITIDAGEPSKADFIQ